eukprot:scaffold2940_cov63-Phaeocystis_antarctica.AAC.7
MAFDHPAGLRHPVVLCEVRAEEGRRRLVSTRFPHFRRPGAEPGAAIWYDVATRDDKPHT